MDIIVINAGAKYLDVSDAGPPIMTQGTSNVKEKKNASIVVANTTLDRTNVHSMTIIHK